MHWAGAMTYLTHNDSLNPLLNSGCVWYTSESFIHDGHLRGVHSNATRAILESAVLSFKKTSLNNILQNCLLMLDLRICSSAPL